MASDSPLPEGFVYPVGYHMRLPRVLDSQILKAFDPFEIPYVVVLNNGQPGVDRNAPVAVGRLRQGRCPNLSSLIRYLELGSSPDEAMQETYNCEDTVTTACDYSEAGFHGTAIEIIRSLPKPFQESGPALQALVQSLTALSRYEEALHKVRLLIASRSAPTQWAQTLHRLEEIQLMMILGKLDEAESIMNERRSEFRSMYQYSGSRAALALLRGDELLARSLIVKAGRVDPYHSYKILWNPLLKPMEAFIRKELLTEEGEPLVYKQDGAAHKIANRIQGALLLGERDRAVNLSEGLILQHVTSWRTAEEAVLVLAGIGDFEAVYEVANLNPARGPQGNLMVRQVARAITTGNEADISVVGTLADKMNCDIQIKKLLIRAVQELATDRTFRLPPAFEALLAEVADGWRDEDRDLFNIHSIGGRFVLTKMNEPRQRRPQDLRNRDLREVFPVIETSELNGCDEVAQWLEEKLTANRSHVPNNAYQAPWMINIDGWNLISSLQPSRATPLVRDAWEIACRDPNFYFQNGPASSFGMNSPFVIRLLTMLTLARPSM